MLLLAGGIVGEPLSDGWTERLGDLPLDGDGDQPVLRLPECPHVVLRRSGAAGQGNLVFGDRQNGPQPVEGRHLGEDGENVRRDAV